MKKKYSLTLALDTLILIGIVFGLLLTITFSLGVERGRKMAYLDQEKQNILPEFAQHNSSRIANIPETEPDESLTPEIPETAEEASEPPLREVAAPEPVEEPPRETAPEPTSTDTGYRIQVATYVHKSRAQKEAQRLKEQDFPTIVEQQGQYSVLFVGNFPRRNLAEAQMRKLKKRYSDCFIKKIN
ncbi:MAG: hypothetical protein GF333_08100 [Candidatus Omnitrophica bacterium]|nr:hypothetical protein [Candidatus Omnitrophota bacterium]